MKKRNVRPVMTKAKADWMRRLLEDRRAKCSRGPHAYQCRVLGWTKFVYNTDRTVLLGEKVTNLGMAALNEYMNPSATQPNAAGNG
jgi:hypothetical protein